MHNNLLKSGNVIKNEDTRVIDSNNQVAERLRVLAERMQNESEDDFYDGFNAGLDAVQVEQLLGDPDNASNQEEAPNFDTETFDQMLKEAKTQADSILAAAREEAEGILSDAKSEAEQIKSKALSDGHDEGYNAGYSEGMEVGRAAEQKCAERESELEAYYARKIEELEPVFVDKLTDIYEHVFMLDLSGKKELIHYLIMDAMRNIEGGKSFLVHVSKEDYEYVNEHREELMTGLPQSSTLEVIEDMTLAQSQCYIEADSGIFDCGLGTELKLLKKELTLLSFRA